MTDVLYTRLKGVADRLIPKYGKDGFVVRKAKSGSPQNPMLTPTRYACKVLDIGYKLTLIPQTLIVAGDKMGLIASTIVIDVDVKDDLVIDGKTYHFKAVEPLNPGGLNLLYEYLARA